jgi:hypothetical protein
MGLAIYLGGILRRLIEPSKLRYIRILNIYSALVTPSFRGSCYKLLASQPIWLHSPIAAAMIDHLANYSFDILFE